MPHGVWLMQLMSILINKQLWHFEPKNKTYKTQILKSKHMFHIVSINITAIIWSSGNIKCTVKLPQSKIIHQSISAMQLVKSNTILVHESVNIVNCPIIEPV